jgi:uncharacterized protein
LGKIFFFIVLALVAYLVIKGTTRSRQRPAANDKLPERMVTCGRCGVHLPESEAVQESGHHFCSEDHRREGAA